MKLLTLQQTNLQKQGEQAKEVFRIEQIRETLKKETLRLNEIESLFEKNLNAQRKRWSEEETKACTELALLQKKIEDYKTKERSFFFPIDAMERKAYDNLEKSKKALNEAEQKQLHLDSVEEKLHDRLDDVEERDNDLDTRERKISSQEQGIRDQQLTMKQMSEALTRKWEEFHKTKNKFETSSANEKRALEIAAQSISDREDALLVLQEEVTLERAKINSERAALKVAYIELQRKQNEKP